MKGSFFMRCLALIMVCVLSAHAYCMDVMKSEKTLQRGDDLRELFYTDPSKGRLSFKISYDCHETIPADINLTYPNIVFYKDELLKEKSGLLLGENGLEYNGKLLCKKIPSKVKCETKSVLNQEPLIRNEKLPLAKTLFPLRFKDHWLNFNELSESEHICSDSPFYFGLRIRNEPWWFEFVIETDKINERFVEFNFDNKKLYISKKELDDQKTKYTFQESLIEGQKNKKKIVQNVIKDLPSLKKAFDDLEKCFEKKSYTCLLESFPHQEINLWPYIYLASQSFKEDQYFGGDDEEHLILDNARMLETKMKKKYPINKLPIPWERLKNLINFEKNVVTACDQDGHDLWNCSPNTKELVLNEKFVGQGPNFFLKVVIKSRGNEIMYGKGVHENFLLELGYEYTDREEQY